MKKGIIQERKRLAEKTGINVDSFLTDKTREEIAAHLESCLTFMVTILTPIIVLNIIFLGLAIGLGIVYSSILMGILFFMVSLIISVIGGGAFGIRNAVNNMVTGIQGLVSYSFQIVREVYKIKGKKEGGQLPSLSDTLRLVMYSVTLPVVEIIIMRKVFLIGKPIYWIIETLLFRITKMATGFIDKLFASKKQGASGAKVESKEGSFVQVEKEEKMGALDLASKKIGDFSRNAVKSIAVLCNIVSVISLVAGSILLVALFIVFRFV